jgi:hypothetical protein
MKSARRRWGKVHELEQILVYVKGMAVEAVEKLAKKVEKPSGRRAA